MISIVKHKRCGIVQLIYIGAVVTGEEMKANRAIYPDGTQPEPCSKIRLCPVCNEPWWKASQVEISVLED